MFLGLNSPPPGFTARGIATAHALKAECMLWLASAGPQDAATYPSQLNVVRLDNWYAGEDPGSYTQRVLPVISRWTGTPHVVYQLGNEPELESGHWGEAFDVYASRLRSLVPGVKLANPPLKAENTQFWLADQLTEADYLSCHCYWQIQFDHDMDNPNLGAAYGHLLRKGRPVVVTEVNAVPASGVASDSNVDWGERDSQVASWAAQAHYEGVHACCIFIADASPDWKAFDVGPESANDIRFRYEAHIGDDEEVEVMVNASAVVAMAQSQIGHSRSGDYDSLNGDHAWAYWCESFVESTHRNLGLSVTPQRSAVSAAAQADLRHGRAPLGAAVYFGTSFYHPDGHVGISMGDGRLLGTLTDGSGVGYRNWNEQTGGCLGWAYYDGVVADDAAQPDPPPVTHLVLPDNPHVAADGREIGLGGGFLRMWQSIDLGGDPFTVLGWPCENEQPGQITDADGSTRIRTVQAFERGVLIYEPLAEFPWDVTVAPLSSLVVPL